MRSIALLVLLAGPAFAQPLVAPTDAKTPEEERKSFKLPPGFTAQLVAAEPDIQKPMQLAFDAKGRIWVTTSYHYPFAAEKGKASDKLFVLSDFGPDGKAKKVETFDDKLNIPIGILPLPDCKSCIVSSVGEILKLTDTDGDGKADQREVLFTGFGSRDTHGMYNSYTYMPDGWVYACHGFANDSRVKGKDGHEVHLNSGNTFRFRPDGSRIEVYTRGQVNPFGMTVDPWFNLYTADCHSKPITQLIKGAYYDSFGKPHDGLGYAPHVTRHDHGSTGLCGLAWYDADHFPAEWNGCMFLGNVVTGRINCDRIEWKGSTPVAKELPDFLVSSDPWFRPVDIKLGPDGALYVNDFYNKIIGHYEVDLKHPGRDKGRGRMWRIVWTGQSEPGASATGASPKMPFTDLTTETLDKLVELSRDSNISNRLLVLQQMGHRLKQNPRAKLDLVPLLMREAAKIEAKPSMLKQFAPSWVEILELAAGHTTQDLADMSSVYSIAANPLEVDPLAIIDVHGLHALADYAHNRIDDGVYEKIHKHLTFKDARSAVIARATAELIAVHPNPQSILPLAKFISTIPSDDICLRHAARIALRNCLAADGSQEQLVWLLKDQIASDQPAAKVLDDVFLGVPTAYAGWWYSERLFIGKIDPQLADRVIQHVGRYGCDCHRSKTESAIVDKNDPRGSAARLAALRQGIQIAGSNYQFSASTRSDLLTWLDSKNDDLAMASLELVDFSDADRQAILKRILSDSKRSERLRIAAVTTLERHGAKSFYEEAREIVNNLNEPSALREKCLAPFATSPKLSDQIVLKDLLKTAPFRQCVTIANGLAGSKSGADLLFAEVKAGKASPRLLQEKAVLDRLKATNVSGWEAKVKELTAGIPSADARLAALIKQRSEGYGRAKKDIEAGKKIFTTTCANCHQVGGQGAKVGPQLDGIGNRGVERLMEDTLDPNRNVDHAFHTTILDLKDGGQLTGLLRVEGKVFIMVDPQAKETRVNEADVEKKRTSPMSPMPSDIAEKLKPTDFYDLIAYLADLRAK